MRKSINKYKEITIKYEKHVEFQNKRINSATSDMLAFFYENVIDTFLEHLGPEHRDFDLFLTEMTNNTDIYDVMIINSDSEEDFIKQVRLLHTDFLENFAIIVE